VYRVGAYAGNPERFLELRLDTERTLSLLPVEMLGRSQSARVVEGDTPNDTAVARERFYLGPEVVELDVEYGAGDDADLGVARSASVWEVWPRATFALSRDHESTVTLGTFDRMLLDRPDTYAPVLPCNQSLPTAANPEALCFVSGTLSAPSRDVNGRALAFELDPTETNMRVPAALYSELFAGLNVHTTPRDELPTIDLVLHGLGHEGCRAAYRSWLLEAGTRLPPGAGAAANAPQNDQTDQTRRSGVAEALGVVCAPELAVRLTPDDYVQTHDSLVHAAVIPHSRPDVVLGVPLLRAAMYVDLEHNVVVLQRAYSQVRYTLFNTVALIPLVVFLV
jgi:hypothetical protein